MAWKLWGNGISHIENIDLMREVELQIDLMELFEPEGYNALEWGKKQTGGELLQLS